MSRVRVEELEDLSTGDVIRVADLKNAGVVTTVPYEAGVEIKDYVTMIRTGAGVLWRVAGNVNLPYTLTGAGIPENGNLVKVDGGDLEMLSDPDSPINIDGGTY